MREQNSDDPEICGCGEPAQEPHLCPFQCEVHGDFEELCTCCKYCEQGCRDEI